MRRAAGTATAEYQADSGSRRNSLRFGHGVV